MVYKEKINGSILEYEYNEYYSRDLYYYYHLILDEIRNALRENKANMTVSYAFVSPDADVSIHLNFEHYIYKKDDKLLFNTGRYFEYLLFDKILEHSNANIDHIKTFSDMGEYLQKLYYFPCLSDDYVFKNNISRINDIVTIHTINDRRYLMLKNVEHTNIIETYLTKDILQEYDSYKLLINAHQTDTNLTFEELRCLPALSSGILILSEDVPYRESIPYHNHIIWCDGNQIESKSKDILKNYEDYRITYLSGIEESLEELKKIKKQSIKTILGI